MNLEMVARAIRLWIAEKSPSVIFNGLNKIAAAIPGKAWQNYWTNVKVTRTLIQIRTAADFQAAWDDLLSKAQGRYCLIQKCFYQYEFWNTSFFREVIAQAMGALCSGYTPLIDVRSSTGINIWETFFEQPFLPEGQIKNTFCEKELSSFALFDRPYGGDIDLKNNPHEDDKLLQYWRNIYAMFFKLNAKTAAYIQHDMQTSLQGKRCCGVLGRGTDYVKLQSSICYRQPGINQLIDKTAAIMQKYDLHYIYLATEDSTIAIAMKNAFPGQVLENKRTYYDTAFREGHHSWIGDVHFDRQNDEYLKGIEYLSSLCILSNCPCLVAGRCGGSEFVDMLKQESWEEKHLFNLGRYNG